MARQRKITTFDNLPKGQCFQIVNGTTDLIWRKRDKRTAVATISGGLWERGRIIDVRSDQDVTRCLSPEQRGRRRSKVMVMA